MDELITIQGSVEAVLFQNDVNGYTVLNFRTEDDDDVTVVGTIPLTTPGERLVVSGKWEHHAVHGPQFRAEMVERLMPSSAVEIEKYLSSRVIRGVGPRTAKRIVERFGEHTFEIMEQEPERLAEIVGISHEKAMQIGQSFAKQFGMRKLLEFLMASELPSELAMPLYKVYGDLAMEALLDDPYLLTDEFFGVDFTTVDAFAIKQGIEAEDERRVEAATEFTLRHNLGNGHTFLPAAKLRDATAQMLGVSTKAVGEAVARLDEMGKLSFDTLRNVDICYLPEYYEAETYVCDRILQMTRMEQTTPTKLEGMVKSIQRENDITYEDKQIEAICLAARSSVMLLTGGPGTGKTTTVNGILALFDRLGIETELAAPTGRAAKRLSELCGRDASTIHRLLETQFSPDTGKLCFMHDESEPLKAEAVVVDETSMVDILLMDALLRALKPGCRLILVGDPDQLPSVGAGNLLNDLLRSGKIPTVRLTQIFRQAQQSLIVMNAHAINQGKMPEITRKDRDFFFLPRGDVGKLVDTVTDLCVRRLPENMGIPASEIQVLSPTRKGETGTANLNVRLQMALNPPAPGKKERKYGKNLFREGDRVMQIKNNYDIIWRKTEGFGYGTGIFNGDVGQIEKINTEEETMTVIFDDRRVEYTFDLLNQLELAYAMTVHKSQGSEYRAVILVSAKAYPNLLTRSILYTAVTRARELLIAVGDPEIINQMVGNDHQQRRYSGLKLRLEKDD